MGLSRRQFTKEFKLAAIQRLEMGALTVAGRGISAPPSTICGRMNRMTISGTEFEFGASDDENNPSMVPASVAMNIVT